MKRLDAFATPVWVEDLPELAPHRERMVQAVRALRAAESGLKSYSTRGGWHSGDDLFGHPEFAVLRDRLVPVIRAVLGDYGVEPGRLSFKLPAWANVHDRGGHNVSHVHPGAWLSGTVYLSVPPGAGRVYFDDPRPAAVMESLPRRPDFQPPPAHARGKFFAQPRDLMVVMFPSWLPHGVEPCECDERISVAFNVDPALMPPG